MTDLTRNIQGCGRQELLQSYEGREMAGEMVTGNHSYVDVTCLGTLRSVSTTAPSATPATSGAMGSCSGRCIGGQGKPFYLAFSLTMQSKSKQKWFWSDLHLTCNEVSVKAKN